MTFLEVPNVNGCLSIIWLYKIKNIVQLYEDTLLLNIVYLGIAIQKIVLCFFTYLLSVRNYSSYMKTCGYKSLPVFHIKKSFEIWWVPLPTKHTKVLQIWPVQERYYDWIGQRWRSHVIYSIVWSSPWPTSLITPFLDRLDL